MQTHLHTGFFIRIIDHVINTTEMMMSAMPSVPFVGYFPWTAGAEHLATGKQDVGAESNNNINQKNY